MGADDGGLVERVNAKSRCQENQLRTVCLTLHFTLKDMSLVGCGFVPKLSDFDDGITDWC
ncbi:MAG: hypothetical protein RLZZ568_679 [Cyanobacteriota bacterium]|jgi:hypothetical protein